MSRGRDRNEIAAALGQCKAAFIGVAVMSGLVNILYLTGSFYMLEVYDRVIPSRSVPTLIGLSVLALVLYGFQGVLEAIRSRILARIGAALDESLSGRVFDIVVRAPLKGAVPGDGLLPLRDLDQIRSFLSGTGPSAFFDLPWMPIYVGICFLFHPYIGVAAIVGTAILAGLTFLTDRATKTPTQAATGHGLRRNGLAESGGATRRCSPPWACSSGWRPAGPWPTATTCNRTRAWPTSAAASAPAPRCSAWRCNRACSRSARGW